MAEPYRRSCIYVLAGPNGGGKSSVAGAMFRHSGADYFNPDEAAARIRAGNPGISQEAANSAAWHAGVRLLKRAMAERLDFAFETTLGGNTITALLQQALSAGIEVRVWYVGLDSPERYDRSRLDLIALMPRLTELRLFDNSIDADPHAGRTPRPTLILHLAKSTIVEMAALGATPQWAKALVAAAFRSR